MAPTILISIFGLAAFIIIMIFTFRYANGKWNVSDQKKSDYLNWTKKYGKTTKKAIIFISVIYGVLMFVQILSLI